ncbi:MAG: hypothetical protein LBG17_03765 [Bacteroidales bacterium]|jgi:uncharacterized membrane protein YbaN (DUF454 family)|nr:hypothetical protein [Bacteroidales bacterium]
MRAANQQQPTFEQVMGLIHQLSDKEKNKIVVTLGGSTLTKSSDRLGDWILSAPTWLDEQYNEYVEGRKLIGVKKGYIISKIFTTFAHFIKQQRKFGFRNYYKQRGFNNPAKTDNYGSKNQTPAFW